MAHIQLLFFSPSMQLTAMASLLSLSYSLKMYTRSHQLHMTEGWRDTSRYLQREQSLIQSSMQSHTGCLLIEGRVEEGTLHCSYHGWRFDAGGRCTHIPQVSGKAAATACASQNSCVASFPTQAWPDIVSVGMGGKFKLVSKSLRPVVSWQTLQCTYKVVSPCLQGRSRNLTIRVWGKLQGYDQSLAVFL